MLEIPLQLSFSSSTGSCSFYLYNRTASSIIGLDNNPIGVTNSINATSQPLIQEVVSVGANPIDIDLRFKSASLVSVVYAVTSYMFIEEYGGY